MHEWTSSHTYSQRVANLSNLSAPGADGTTFGSRENQGYFLQADGPAATVLDDNAADVVTGSAGLDWFVINVDGDSGSARDKATDLGAAEFAADLDWLNSTP